MLGHQSVRTGAVVQEMPCRVVQAQCAAVQLQGQQQREVCKLDQQILRRKRVELGIRGLRPKSLDDADRDVGVFGKHPELAEAQPLLRIEQVQRRVDDLGDRAQPILVAHILGGIERHQAACVEAAGEIGDGAIQRHAPANALLEEAVGELQELRPFAETGGHLAEHHGLVDDLISWQIPAEQRARFAALHGVHHLACGLIGQHRVEPGGDQPRGVAPAVEERVEMRALPDIVDNQQDSPIAEHRVQGRTKALKGRCFWGLAGQQRDEIGQQRLHPAAALFAQFDPQHAVEVGVLDVRIMGQRLGQRGLAVAARTAQCRGDRHSIALAIQQLLFERLELPRPRDEVGRRFRRHHRHAGGAARHFQNPEEVGAALRDGEIVEVAEPAGHRRQIVDAGPAHRQHGLALLPGQPDLPAHYPAGQSFRRHHQNEMLQ